ncbi:MAG: UDP-forming cellulose synthase catalytic subunit [Acidobacteriota bacterium]|nr:UDP-forming cellulose synthase catalytic subunit [Acidobacteriota bacterium]
MSRSPILREFESGDGLFFRFVRFAILAGGIFLLGFTGVLELTWPQQIVLGMMTVGLVIWLDHSSSSYLVTLTLMLASIFSTFRYGFWRISTTVRFFSDPGSMWDTLDAFFIGLLLLAEAYAFLVLLLGYLQTLWPLRRTPVALPDDPEAWPAVDLLIPTFNEPLSVVKFTALAAMNIDWPADKLNVYLLDDGRREQFRRFAEEAGVGYMTRDGNEHAKAGNINHALAKLNSPFVAVFDCDHVPTRSFLQVTMGWFLRDTKLGMLQTPQHCYSPDPFERNLDQFRTIPSEDELFYGVVQDGNDFWNATFFCGSCAVLRRSALDEIGGIAVETVTEDAHTSLRMQSRGWNAAYINIPQAAGLATERLSGHVKQRIRWARGMVQILRIDNPLFARGLSAPQRLCYFNAMMHFLFALPRLIFLTAPLVYLLFGHVNLPGFWAAIVAYAMPHLVLSNVTNSRIQGQHRHSFWNEIYETVLAPCILLPTLWALISPKTGGFKVTDKGGMVNDRFFDRRLAQPFIFLIAVNLLGLLCSIPRLFPFSGADAPWPRNICASMYDGGHVGTIVMNLLWVCFNLVILGVAAAVAWESRQRRQTVRLSMTVPVDVQLRNGSILHGVTTDMSSGGLMVRMERNVVAAAGEALRLTLPLLDTQATLPAIVVGIDGKVMRAKFDALSLPEEEALAMVLYSRADTWLGWGQAREADKPLTSLKRIFELALLGFSQILRGLFQPGKSPRKANLVTSVVPLILMTVILGGCRLAAQVAPSETQHHQALARPDATPPRSMQANSVLPGPPAPGSFDDIVALSDMGVEDAIVLHGTDARASVGFSLPQNRIVKTATLHLRYHFSPGLLPALSHLKVSLNGTLHATLVETPLLASTAKSGGPAGAAGVHGEHGELQEATVSLPAGTLAHDNVLTFEFVGHYTTKCEDPSHSALWSSVDNNSTLEFAGTLTPLHDDLKLLPAPFYDSAVRLRPVVPIVFLSPPSAQALQAAGIVASWFGVLAGSRPVRFPVSIGTIPAGNAIVIAESRASLPVSLNINIGSGPSIAMRPNPSDVYSKVMVLSGESGDEVLHSAYGLLLQRDLLEGDQVHVPNVKLPSPREPDDAPRWLSTQKITALGELPEISDLKSDGSGPIALYLRLPPDLYFGSQRNLRLHLGYRYNGIPLANGSSLQVTANDSYVGSAPLPHTDRSLAQLDTVVPVPVSDLGPFSNSVLLRFLFQYVRKGECEPAPNNLEGSILKDTYLDLQGIPHWAALPNLELFANAGYPFTRRADLSETAVVMPETPSLEEIEMYVTLMGHFGAQTGYPVLNLTVTTADGMKNDRRKDYLVLGTVNDQPAIGMLNASLPVGIDGSGMHIQDTQGFFAQMQHAWWKVRSSDSIRTGELETAGGLPDALIEGIEWPSGSNRSVVVVALRDHDVVADFLPVFLKNSQGSDISQSVSVLHGSRFVSYRIGDAVYHVGELSPWARLNIVFSENQFLMVLAILLSCFLLAAILRSVLRRRARARLQGS